MAEIRHIIADELGMHARPAAQLAKRCGVFESEILIGTAAKMVDARRILGVMGLALKHGDELIMTFNGPDADAASLDLKRFLTETL